MDYAQRVVLSTMLSTIEQIFIALSAIMRNNSANKYIQNIQSHRLLKGAQTHAQDYSPLSMIHICSMKSMSTNTSIIHRYAQRAQGDAQAQPLSIRLS